MLRPVLAALLLGAPMVVPGAGAVVGDAMLAGGTVRPVSLSPAASARAVVTGNDAALGGWRAVQGSSMPCIMDALFDVQTWTDARGTVRRLVFRASSAWNPDRTEQRIDWDEAGRPRAYSWALRRMSGQDTVAARIELLIGPAGQVVQSREWGAVQPEHRIPWPTLERELRPAELIERYTCPPLRIP
ncbi:hypothetical protein M8445_00320 [Deinococcus aquaticus]|uniref:DUF3047 domain-containing protein n=1 Tax=Deinococcus aquaticus TaxID=328692 RepID=A0ABY7V0M6_9DEIO|nr:hypothetical protein [Deinococcus aquaticus]WDA58698.1 hypothetical protein M8445_00320 [Deinococcus aquaticus]